LNDEIEEKKMTKKTLKQFELIHNLDHENVTNPYKVNKKIYETQFSINLTLKDKVEKKNQLKNNISQPRLIYQT